MNFYEFGVTNSTDWQDVKTIYIEAECSQDAINYVMKLTSASECDRDNERFPFADFRFRTAIPFCCIERGAIIYRKEEQ